MKKIVVLLFLGLLNFSFYGQSKIVAVKGIVSVPFCFLQEEQSEEYTVEYYNSPKEAVEQLSKGNGDFSILSYYAALELENKSEGGLKIVAQVTQPDFEVITRLKNVAYLSDLIGMTVYVPGKGQAEKYLLWLLDKNGIAVNGGENSVKINTDYTSEKIYSMLLKGEIQAALLSGTAKTAALRGPKRTYSSVILKNEIKAVAGAPLKEPLTVLVARKQLVDSDLQLVSKIIQDLNSSALKITANPEKADRLCKKYNTGVNPSYSVSTISSIDFRVVSLIEK